MSEVDRREEGCRLRLPEGRWLSTGVHAGYARADRAVNLTVPTPFDRTDLSAYVADRCAAAGFDADGPALLTAVDQADARAARAGPVTVVATAGLSNPASLPVPAPADQSTVPDERPPPGTVNLLVGTTRALSDGALASCLATAVEAKTATLQALSGFTGTTTDAIAVGCDPDGEPAAFVGSSTEVGRSVRACVRDAVRASLEATDAEAEPPSDVADAPHGAVTARSATVFEP